MLFPALLSVLLLLGWSIAAAAALEDGAVTVNLDGTNVQLHYFRVPPADPAAPSTTVMFFHGLPTSNAIWVPVMLQLAQLANIDAYALSFPGFGRSSAPSPESFAYGEEIMSRVPYLAADALGIERFVGVVHDAGGPWFMCGATQTGNLDRLDGLVIMNSLLNVNQLPLQPLFLMQQFSRLLANPRVSQRAIAWGFRIVLEAATDSAVQRRFPAAVEEIARTNSTPANRRAIAAVFDELKRDPLAFGGRCGPRGFELDRLKPLLIWARPNLEYWLFVFQALWPSATTVLVDSEAHFLMLDEPEKVAGAITAYIAR